MITCDRSRPTSAGKIEAYYLHYGRSIDARFSIFHFVPKTFAFNADCRQSLRTIDHCSAIKIKALNKNHKNKDLEGLMHT